MDFFTFCLTLAIPLAYTVGRAKAREYAREVREEIENKEPRCTGYNEAGTRDAKGRFKASKIRTDCKGLRSTGCVDGRCSFHCAHTCKCEEKHVRIRFASKDFEEFDARLAEEQLEQLEGGPQSSGLKRKSRG